ncbi:HEPN domain-containing protein [Oxalobacteraceae bacterium A2-2]
MLTTKTLRQLSSARWQDARILYETRRYDGAYYLCGYAVELALKARICRTLRWPGYPSTNKEFEHFRSFKVHDLEVLLQLTGREAFIKNTHFSEWSEVSLWNPEVRYQQGGNTTAHQAHRMLRSASVVISRL